MDLETFWWDDEEYFDVYVKAYHDRTNREAWLNGLYIHKATNASIVNCMPIAISVSFGSIKRDKIPDIQYCDKPIDFSSQKNVDEISNKKELSNEEYMRQSLNQWI